MGNRACVIFADTKFKRLSPAVYLHWNGGPESVYAFLNELDVRRVRPDQDYECARFIGIVHEFFSPSPHSLGVTNSATIGSSTFNALVECASDNGVFVVCREGKTRVVRRFVVRYNEDKSSVCELTPAGVQDEHDCAMAHAYNSDPKGDTMVARLARSLAAITEANKKEHHASTT